MRWILLSLGLVCGPVFAQHQHHDMAGGDASARYGATFARFSSEMDAGMDKMMRDMHAPGYTGDPDIDFLAMMIPHHEGAVEMARLVLIHGRDPLTRKLAEEIIASQVVEIEGMKRRLAILRAKSGPEKDEFPALGGTRGPAP
jgi:uncharacterized protein (DUF305 family)